MDEEIPFDDVIEKFAASEPKFVDPVEPPVDDDQETPDDDQETDDQPEDEEAQDDEDASDTDGEDTDTEDPETEVEVGSEKRKVRVSELKKLYAEQEAIQGRAKAAAEQNRVVEAQGLFLAKLYEDRLTRAQAVAARYANVDLFQAYRELDSDEFDTLKAAKEAAEAELAQVSHEAHNFMNNVTETKRAYLREQAKQSIAVIRKEIPDWTDEVYNKVRTYAVSQGMDQSVANEIVDASAIIMMHKAMLYDNAKAGSKVVTKKVVKAPKKVVKKGDTPTDTNAVANKRLIAAARTTGSIDDVAEAFLAASRRK